MGKTLYTKSRAFKAAMDECDRLLRTSYEAAHECLQAPGLVQMLYMQPEEAQTEAFKDPGFTQPALFCVEYAIAQVFLQEVLPSSTSSSSSSSPVPLVAVLGHSLGEITAACVAGMLTLADACRLAAGRGKAMAEVPSGNGAMAACRANQEQVAAILKAEAPEAVIAAVNGPSGVVVSGSVVAIDQAVAGLEAAKIMVRKLQVSHGFHSAQISTAIEALRAVASALHPKDPAAEDGVHTVSNVTGRVMTRAPDAQYWVDHALGRVQFMSGVETAIKELGCTVVLEVGPQPHLSPHIERIAEAMRKRGEKANVAVLRTLRAGKDEMMQVMTAVGGLFVAGVDIDWPAVYASGLGYDPGCAPTIPRQVSSACMHVAVGHSHCAIEIPSWLRAAAEHLLAPADRPSRGRSDCRRQCWPASGTGTSRTPRSSPDR
eukprot:SAG22_NODE_592_length_8810_cov_3.873264_4_plen_431_part_00